MNSRLEAVELLKIYRLTARIGRSLERFDDLEAQRFHICVYLRPPYDTLNHEESGFSTLAA